MLKFVMARMSEGEMTEFRDKPYFYECQKTIQDHQVPSEVVEMVVVMSRDVM